MSYKEFNTAIELIEKNKDKCEGIAIQELIKVSEAEKELNIDLPKSYKEFLCKYGHLMVGGEHIYGLLFDSMVRNTKYERETNRNSAFPTKYIVIHSLGNGEVSCLDTSQMNNEGECPVVAWYFGTTKKLTDDFGSFLLEKVIWGLESLEEDGLKVDWLGIKK